MQNYHILERIGEGSFGKVYRGRRKYSGHIVALKFVSKRGKTEKNMYNLRQEINILRGLNHSNIIAMLDSFETEGEFCMVTEYAQGELFQILEDDHELPEDEIKRIAVQLIQALHYLHSNRIIHRDMKPQNILVGPKQQIKLCDFGFARAISADTNVLTSIKGTPLYMAPELVKEQPYNHTVDLWSLGVILYELATGRPPFYTDKIVTLIQLIVKENVKYPSMMSAEFKSFLSGLLQKDPSKRLTWPEILAHPFACETALQMESRQALERQVRRLPSFQNELVHGISTLQRSVEWNAVDPETGQVVLTAKKTEVRDATATATKQIEGVWKAYETMATTAGDDGFLQVLDATTLLVDLKAAMQSPDATSVRFALYVVHRVVHQATKANKGSVKPEHAQLLEQIRRCLLNHIPGILLSCREGVLQMVRTLMLPMPTAGNCKDDLDMIALLLREVTDTALLAKVLKWLGTNLDHPDNAPIVYNYIVHQKSEVIGSICALIGHDDPNIGTYAIFALSSLSHPNGPHWDITMLFPATQATQAQASVPTPPEKLALLRSTYALRVKLHTELSNHLFKTGLTPLLAKFHAEVQAVVAHHTTDTEREEDDDPHTMLTNLLKVLFYGCRVSSPLSKCVAESTSLITPAVLDGCNVYERYFALELVAVCKRRGVLSPSTQPYLLFVHELQRHGDAPDALLPPLVQSAVCSLMAETIEGENSVAAAAVVVDLVPLLSLSLQCTPATDETLFCFGIRAAGILDSSVIVLYRVVSTLVAGLELDLLHRVMHHLEAHDLWTLFCTLLADGGRDALSPWGLFCLLKLLRVLTEHMTETDQFLPTHLARQATLLPLLVALLRPSHIQHLLQWPDVVGGGLQAVKAMVHAIVKVVSMPFLASVAVSEELLFRTQELLYESGCVGLLLGVLSQHALEMDVLVKFLSRLVTSSPHFATQFVDANGLILLKSQGLLKIETASLLVQDALVLVSHVARSARAHYRRIEAADLFVELRDLLAASDPLLRAKTCNCLGNLSRHSNYFYDHFVQPLPPTQQSLLDGLLRCVQDTDTPTRRYASFAIGNAAFHTDQLSRALLPAIPFLVLHLRDADTKTRSNAAAALGNLVRQSATCCGDLVAHQAPFRLLECALDETDLATRRFALFSLGNLCEYDLCRQSLSSTDALFAHSLQGLSDDSADEMVKKYVRRILSKWHAQ
ncbi:Aste57867_19308 [Aphanomyces stellatus]|uniref:non-specific serine/threonine protein kinase n=1 Tax=Aphanomyces stellatus TaxID=120398 RepID=A0A485LGI4_9STRA|nr:hypothetical protein As57867_019244 [Aphanomyces stellatus]VFT96026.1 Aste57867_19308 [Aphanomyces stellatus]